MMLTAQPVDAQKAFAWGLVTAVADEGKLIEAAREMAEQIVALPPNALRGTKQLLRGAEDRNLDQELAAAAQMQATLDRKSTRLNSSHSCAPRMPASACTHKHHPAECKYVAAPFHFMCNAHTHSHTS